MLATSYQTCGEEMNYRCLSCTKPTCNMSSSCSIDAPEETTGWKAGSFVSFCVSCTRSAATGKEQLPRGTKEAKKTKKDSQRDTAAGSHLQKNPNVLIFHRRLLFSSSRKTIQILEAERLLITLVKPRFKLFYEAKNPLRLCTKVTSAETK